MADELILKVKDDEGQTAALMSEPADEPTDKSINLPDVVSETAQPEKKKDWFNDFMKASTVNPNEIGYVPLPIKDQAPDPTGSVYLAHSRQTNAIGSMLNRSTTYSLDDAAMKQYPLSEVIGDIPKTILALGYEDRYIGLNPEQRIGMTANIEKELQDKSLLAAHPWQSLMWDIVDPLDPLNWLFSAKIFKQIQTSSRVGRSMLSSGIATAGLVGANEVVLQANQVTRELDESLFNVAAAGVIGSVMGGIGASLTPVSKAELEVLEAGIGKLNAKERLARLNEWRIRKTATKEVTDVLMGKEKVLTKEGNLTENDIVKIHPIIQKSMRFTAKNRMATSDSPTVKKISDLLYEGGMELRKHSAGIESETSLERRILARKKENNVASAEILDIYFDMHGIPKGPLRQFKQSRTGVDMNLDQFNDAMSLVRTDGVQHKLEHVNKATKLWIDKVLTPITKDLIELGMLPKDISLANAIDHFMIVYNKNKIKEQGGRSARGEGTFPQHLFDQFKLDQEIARQYKQSPKYIAHQVKIKALKDRKAKLSSAELASINTRIKEIGTKIKTLDTDFNKLSKSKTGRKRITKKEIEAHRSKIQKLEKEKQKILREKEITAKDKKLLTKEIKKIQQLVLDDAPKGSKTHDNKLLSTSKTEKQLWIDAEQTVDNIMGNTEGVLLNPVLESLGKGVNPLKARRLLIDQVGAREWHVTGASQVSEIYTRAMLPFIEMEKLAIRQGSKSIKEYKLSLGAAIKKEYDELLEGVTGKQAQKISKKRDGDIRDVNASFDLLMGVYGRGVNVLDDSAAKYYRAIMAWNYVRLLGHQVIASVVDVGNLVTKHGPYKLVHGTLLSMGSIAREMSKSDARGMGYAMETVLGTRLKSYSEHTGLSTTPNPWSKGLDSMTQGFGNLSLINPWNDEMHIVANLMGTNRSLEMIHKIVSGEKVAQKEITRLAQLGLSKEHFQTIAKFTEGNVDPKTGARYANYAKWNVTSDSEVEAIRQFQAHIAKEIDMTILTPGLGDIPLISQKHPTVKLVLQFKSFGLASTNRTLYPNMQRLDQAEMYLGYVSMLALGGMSYIANSYSKGKTPDLSFDNLAIESLDKSGILGIWMDIGNTTGKVLDIPGVSRYRTRDKWGAVLGPTAGAASDLAEILNKFGSAVKGSNNYSTKDAEKIKRLAPLQNIFLWDYAVNEGATKFAVKIGAKDKRENKNRVFLGPQT